MSALYSTEARAVGGRAGHVKSSDGLISLDLAMPKELGGKGGATALGVGIALAPMLALYGGLTWLAVAILLRYSSLATLMAIASAPVYAWMLGHYQIAEAFVPVVLLIWAKHHANIRRLLTGQEPKIVLK